MEFGEGADTRSPALTDAMKRGDGNLGLFREVTIRQVITIFVVFECHGWLLELRCSVFGKSHIIRKEDVPQVKNLIWVMAAAFVGLYWLMIYLESMSGVCY